MSIWGLRLYDRIQRARVMSQPEERYGLLPAMMSWAETAAREESISREACDRWSLDSHRKACSAQEAGKFADERGAGTVTAAAQIVDQHLGAAARKFQRMRLTQATARSSDNNHFILEFAHAPSPSLVPF